MKKSVTDFEGQYKAYTVETDNGGAERTNSYAVDIGGAPDMVFSASEAAGLYGATKGLQVVNADWPSNVRIRAHDIKLVTLTVTFNELMRMGAEFSKKHGGQKVCQLRGQGGDKISTAFAKIAAEEGLRGLGEFYVTSDKQMQALRGRVPEIDQDGDAVMENPAENILALSSSEAVLPELHSLVAFNEIDFPGWGSQNKFHITGVFLGQAKDLTEADFPINSLSGSDGHLPRVMQELRRTL